MDKDSFVSFWAAYSLYQLSLTDKLGEEFLKHSSDLTTAVKSTEGRQKALILSVLSSLLDKGVIQDQNFKKTWRLELAKEPEIKDMKNIVQTGHWEFKNDSDVYYSCYDEIGVCLIHEKEPQFDIVFIQGFTEDELKVSQKENSWWSPQFLEYISQDMYNARILTVKYIPTLKNSESETSDLSYSSLEILKKLKQAKVGNRPTVFITHSLGGLITKQMMIDAKNNEEYSDILQNTFFIAFYSTPHKGSGITQFAEKSIGVFKNFANAPILNTLRHQDPKLFNLQANFLSVASHISTISFGELIPLPQPKNGNELIVPRDAANPNLPEMTVYNQKKVYNWYYDINADHKSITQPATNRDTRYTILLDKIKFLTQQET